MKTQLAFPSGIIMRALAALAAMCLTAAAALAIIPVTGAGANSAPSTATQSQVKDGVEITLTGVIDVGDDIQISGATATRVQTPTE